MRLYFLIGFLSFRVAFFIGTQVNNKKTPENFFANALRPSAAQLASFSLGEIKTSVLIPNLLKSKDKAEYGDGRDSNLSGREAYSIYAREVPKHLKKVGAEPVIAGNK